MYSKKSLLLVGAGLLSITTLVGCNKNEKKDEYTRDGKLKVSIRNLYFDNYSGGDSFLADIEEQFSLKIDCQPYDYNNWNAQVSGEVNGRNVPDVFHANIDSYNFANSYKFWANKNITKPLPEDLSRWPNLEAMINNLSNVESLKIGGKLYGIPIAKNTSNYHASFSPFTYLYRRDWAKKWGVYQENDVYTWEQFTTLVSTFANRLHAADGEYALGDVPWGFPSVINFYKQVPHCFAYDEENEKYINNYTTAEYMAGLKVAKQFMSSGWYYSGQHEATEDTMNNLYCGSKIGIYYQNLSYENYVRLKKLIIKNNASVVGFDADEAMAIIKIKGPDGSIYTADKFALEGTDNWFSMTLFDKRISNKKQEMVLDMLDYLLSEEGTRFAIYGREGYDYIINDHGEIELVEEYWPKDQSGNYLPKVNGAKRLRQIVSLGYDTLTYDPVADHSAIDYLNSWTEEMDDAYNNGELYVLEERAAVKWLTSKKKSKYSGKIRADALDTVKLYVYNTAGYRSDSEYKSHFGSIWNDVLSEINKATKQ